MFWACVFCYKIGVRKETVSDRLKHLLAHQFAIMPTAKRLLISNAFQDVKSDATRAEHQSNHV